MMYLTVALSKSFEHRYKFDAYVYNLLEKDFEQVTVFLLHSLLIQLHFLLIRTAFSTILRGISLLSASKGCTAYAELAVYRASI